jgi:hypothetical protein
MQSTLVDPFEIRFRAKQQTLLDPFELRCTPTIENLDDWEQATRDVCVVIVEQSPRGIRYESWRRARSWCSDER